MEIIPETIKPSVAQFMSYVHGSVNEMSKVYLQNERRHNYTTPKSFLELINLYVKILQGMISKSLFKLAPAFIVNVNAMIPMN